MIQAIEYFSVFGGMDLKIDINKPIIELIKEHILNDYIYLRNHIHKLTGGYSVDHAVLTGIALGDRKTNSSFKRAHVSFEEGMKCIDNLCETGVIEIESPQNFLIKNKNNANTSKKLLFTTPFLRFWFAFVSPIYKGIKEGNFEEFYKKYESKKNEFLDFIVEELTIELIIDLYGQKDIKIIGKYWDNDENNLDVVVKTKEGKIIAGNCKYTNNKIKKNELQKLKNTCVELGVNADIHFLFTKTGFSTEVKALKGDNLKLFTPRNLKVVSGDF